MKILGWMQNKFNARFGCNTLHSISVTHNPARQEIGPKEEFSDWPNGTLLAIETFGNTKNVKDKDPAQENQEFTVEQVENLEKELNLFLDLDDTKNTESTLVFGGGKAVNNVDNTINNNINKKSFSFLLKKMFVCRAEFTPSLNLTDQVPESNIDKIIRAILHKKIYPHNQNSTNSSIKKVLQKKHKLSDEEETNDDDDDKGSKWVKTDSEYIVLEI